MIYLRHDGKKYGIQFVYFRDVQNYRKDTQCDIYELESDDWTGKRIVFGFTKLHPSDNFCAEEGRRRSLQSALRKIDDRSFRTAVWEGYRNRITRRSDID